MLGKAKTRRETYEMTDRHAQVSRAHRPEVDRAVGALVAALRRAGVSYDEANAPMTDVNRIILSFRANGDFRRPELLVAGMYDDVSGCPIWLGLEPYPDEEEEEN